MPISLPVSKLYVKNRRPTCLIKAVSTNPRDAITVPTMVTMRLPYSSTRALDKKPATNEGSNSMGSSFSVHLDSIELIVVRFCTLHDSMQS